MSHSIVHFEIPAESPEKAMSFYRGLFGWKFTKAGDSPDMGYWLIETVPVGADGRPTEQGVNGGLAQKMMPEQTPINYVQVESVDQYMEKVKELGGTITVPKMPVPGMGWFAHCTDPEGNPFAIWEEDSKAT